MIFRLEGGVYRFAAGYSLDQAYLEHERRTPICPGPGTVVGRAAMGREVVQIEDAYRLTFRIRAPDALDTVTEAEVALSGDADIRDIEFRGTREVAKKSAQSLRYALAPKYCLGGIRSKTTRLSSGT